MKQRAQLTKEQKLQNPGLITERPWELGGPFLRCPPGRQRTRQRCQVLSSLQRLRMKEKIWIALKKDRV